MQTKTLGQPFAAGRTAEVYNWEDGKILKLYRDWCPPEWLEYEYRIAGVVEAAGIPTPKVGEIVSVQGRRGITYERVEGPSMLVAMSRSPLRLAAYARALAELHVTMHTCRAPDLPSQRARLVHSVNAAKNLPEAQRQAALKSLENLPDGDRLCHGDFHPGNVLITRQGPLVIDWMTGMKGHPAADVARTHLLLTIGDAPDGGVVRLMILLGRGMYVRSYFAHYRQRVPEIETLAKAFTPITAAARMNEDIAPEREKLLALIGG